MLFFALSRYPSSLSALALKSQAVKKATLLIKSFNGERLSKTERLKTRERSVIYEQIPEEFIDDFIANAERSVAEARDSFLNKIEDPVERATLIIESRAGEEAEARQNYKTLFEIAAFANIQNPEIKKADAEIDQIALRLAAFLSEK